MKAILISILALLLCLPVQALSYVQTVLHVAQHEHDEDEAEDHDHHDHDDHGHDLSHRHAPDEPVHSHDRDIWGLFAHSGLQQEIGFTYDHSPSQAFDHPFFHLDDAISEPLYGSLLRPPIG